MPETHRYDAFVKGETVLGQGRFWMVNMLKFKPGGAAEYRKYEAAVKPLLSKVGAKIVFRLYSHVQTAIFDGAGAVPAWDGVFIMEYPSPAEFHAFASSSKAYRAAHAHRFAALEATELYACDAAWYTAASGIAVPDTRLDMSIPRELASEKEKDAKAMAAISPNPKKFMSYVQDERFQVGRLWQLNFLKYEPGDRAKYYLEYAARAQSHISGSMIAGSGGGWQVPLARVVSLRGPEWDAIGIMQYPSMRDFHGYLTGSDRSGEKGMNDGIVLRTAGLAIQGLVSMCPESDFEAVQDPDGPKVSPAAKL